MEDHTVFTHSPAVGAIQEKQVQIQKTNVEAEKVAWEIELLKEKIKTEQVEQQVKMNGINFDTENLSIKKAELMAEMNQQSHSQQMDKANFVSGVAQQKEKADVEKKKVDVAEKSAMTKKSESKGTPPYREKGMKSNNQKTGSGGKKH